MKKALIILASLMLIVILAVIFAPKFIDWNEKIAVMVEDATGRELRIGGDIKLSIFPNLEFSASDIHLANAPGMKAADMVSVGAVSGKLRLLPLLGRRVVVDSLVLSDPSVNLEVDREGNANWVFGTKEKAVAEPAQKPSGGGGGLPVKDITLNGVSMTRGSISLNNALTGQIIDTEEIDLSVALANFATPLTLKLRLTLNDTPVSFDLSLDTFKKLLDGLPAEMNVSLASKFVNTGYKGSVQVAPVPGLDGTFDLDIPSTGRLAAWLGQPLGASRPDPGPLKVHAAFTGDGAKVALTEAVIDGTALKVKATGSYDGSGDIAKLALDVASETLDIDRYLPEQPAGTARKQPAGAAKTATGREKTTSGKEEQKASGDIMAAFSSDPLDFSGLRKTEADVRIAVNGIRAMGFKTGRIDFTGNLEKGLLTANLNTEGLYGGNVAGTLKLDAAGDALGVDTKIKIDAVEVGRLIKAATGDDPPLSGVASGSVSAVARGADPRSLVESLKGGIVFDLGGVDMKKTTAHTVSEIKLRLDLPGIESPPNLSSSVVYNKQRVDLALSTDPLTKVLSGDAFKLKASVDSKLLHLIYDGKLQQRPVPGLDGVLNLDIPSVGGVASWLGQPLDRSQPDPGPLKLSARFTGDGSKASLDQATLEGKAVKVTAKGSLDNAGPVPVVMAEVQVVNADLNAYLPKSEGKKKPAKKQKAGKKQKPGKKPAAESPPGWSEEPLDLTPLGSAEADVLVTINSLKYKEVTVKKGRIKVALKGGVLNASVEDLLVAEGTIASRVKLDASGRAAGLDYQVTIADLAARPFLTSFAGNDRLSGSAAFQAKGAAKGGSLKELVDSLNSEGQFKFIDGAIHGINIPATLRKAGSLGLDKEAGKEVKTDFAELSGSFVIRNGVLENRDLKMLAPLLRLSGEGMVPLPDRAVDYDLTATLVASLKGQGAEDSLAGVPIPVNVKGPWEKLAFNVNWKKVFGTISLDPERLKDLPGSLREVGKGFGLKLPSPAPSGQSGAATAEKGATPMDLLRGIVPKKKASPEGSTETKSPEEEKKPEKLDPSKLLKGLFN